jgi:FkbH-like protein
VKYTSADAQKELFRKHRRLTQGHQDDRDRYVPIKVAFLSGITIHPLKDIVETLLLESGVNPTLYEGDYDSYRFEARFSSALQQFDPEVVYLHTSIDNLQERAEIGADHSSVAALIDRFWDDQMGTIDALLARSRATVIVNTFELPNYRMSGNLEAVADGGMVRYIHTLNQRLADLARDNARVILNDTNYLSAKVGLENWRDDQGYIAFKQPFTSRAVVEIARSLASLILVIQGKANKCLILDLDNTLWGGIIGDDGPENIEIGMDTPRGEAYLTFQKAIRPLLGRGIALAVCSKNDDETARAGLRREAMHLKEEDFHVLRINWNPKSENIREIKDTLNIGLDSIVFVDDSEFERREVRYNLPSLNVIDIQSDPITFIRALSDEYAFETPGLSAEDLKRGSSFKAMVELAQCSGTANEEGFLASLLMSICISPVSPENEARVHQLINKTNQFNLTTKRMTLADVQAYQASGVMLCVSLKDRSTDYGLISVLWGDMEGDHFKLANWVMSCRVFNRKLEHVVYHRLHNQLVANGVKKISASFVRSAKNNPVATLLTDLGLRISRANNETTLYEVTLPSEAAGNLAEMEKFYS